jgi:exodeoxyribonuclease III
MIVTRHKPNRVWYHFCTGAIRDEKTQQCTSAIQQDQESLFFNVLQSQDQSVSQDQKSHTIDIHGDDAWDHQARVITLEYDTFFLVNVYSPNSKSQFAYRIKEWEPRLRHHISYLAQHKPVIVAGDFNVIHTKRDSMNLLKTKTLAGSLPEEQHAMSQLIHLCKLYDTYRYLHPSPHVYTWRSQKGRDTACRLDYIFMSDSLESALMQSTILYEIAGSDHVPIQASFRRETFRLQECPLTSCEGRSFHQSTMELFSLPKELQCVVAL